MQVPRELAKDPGVDIPSASAGENGHTEKDPTIRDILTDPANYHHEKLTSEATEYHTKDRGLSEWRDCVWILLHLSPAS